MKEKFSGVEIYDFLKIVEENELFTQKDISSSWECSYLLRKHGSFSDRADVRTSEILKLMERSRPRVIEQDRKDRQRKYYSITAEGRRILQDASLKEKSEKKDLIFLKSELDYV